MRLIDAPPSFPNFPSSFHTCVARASISCSPSFYLLYYLFRTSCLRRFRQFILPVGTPTIRRALLAYGRVTTLTCGDEVVWAVGSAAAVGNNSGNRSLPQKRPVMSRVHWTYQAESVNVQTTGDRVRLPYSSGILRESDRYEFALMIDGSPGETTGHEHECMPRSPKLPCFFLNQETRNRGGFTT